MGRRAKHCTVADKALAAKAYNLKYNQTPHAKSLRHLQNKTAYQQRTYNSSSSTKHQHPTFPASLHRRAIAKLRTTSHFRDAHQGLSIPTLHLGIWEPPQYLPTVSSDTSHQDRPALLMLDILHATNGHQLRLIEEQGHGRRKLSRDDEENGRLVREMLDEVDARLAQWIDCDDKFERFEGSEWETMAGELALEWGAKVIHCLKDEIRARQKGHLHYLEAYEGRQLAWQCIEVFA